MVHYKPVKITINASGLAKFILNIIVWHYGIPDSIITDRGLPFISNFYSLLYYFFDIMARLFTDFHLQTNGQSKKQNGIIEVYP